MWTQKHYRRALDWSVAYFNACCGQHAALTAILFLFFLFANIIAVTYIPGLCLTVIFSLSIIFLLLDGFLLALDLKAAEQRVQDLNIFKSNEILYLINKARENQELLVEINKRLWVLEKKKGLVLPIPRRISDNMLRGMEEGRGCFDCDTEI
jgi:hypothetical protein